MSKRDFLNDYVEVNVRVEKFWNDYPNGRIETEIIKWEDQVITMKASVYKNVENEQPDATGHAYEKEGSSYINKTSALENCETSAVGRALALMGYEIKKSIASKEEVENAKHQQQQINKQDDKNYYTAIKSKYETAQTFNIKGFEKPFDEWYKLQKTKWKDPQIEGYLTKVIKGANQ
ncbi:MAG: hypothetical protein FH761_16545 [Firmicutes bacterium]|nr:hypothetical protein [Bacillota bacterium]